MSIENYKGIFKNTFDKQYPIYFIETFLRGLEEHGIVHNDKRKKNNDGYLDISIYSEIKTKLDIVFSRVDNIVKKCEEFEYERAYRYSYIFKLKNFDCQYLNNLIDNGSVGLFSDDSQYDDVMNMFISRPTCKADGDKIILKFSFRLESKLEDGFPIKHTVLAVIDPTLEIVEIRQDGVPMAYKQSDKFYIDNVRNIKMWFMTILKCTVEEIDFQAVTKYMKSHKGADVVFTAVKFKRDGMTADLDSASNVNLTLPILDELRQKIDTNEIFNADENTKKIKKLLDDFIEEIEENSELPAVKILWKEKGYKINAYHGQTLGESSSFKWIGELKDKESMDYVTRYLINCEIELRESLDN